VVILGALLFLALTTAAGAQIPNPTVIGPIPVPVPLGDPSHNYPFFASNQNLAYYGYVEEEYFLKGTANQYNTSNTANATIKSSGNPYEVRILVRRPILPQHFNGTVMLEWLNVTNNFEMDVEFYRTFDYIMRTGAIHVGVGPQRVGIHAAVTGLKAWNPTRYGNLDVTVGGTITDDSLKYDIYSQAAQALRSPVAIDPLAGMRPKVLIATGDSQSASTLATYYNSVHPLNPIFDVFVPTGNLGTTIRTDLTTKYWKLDSEYDVISSDARVYRPDTNVFVTWQIAGASHSYYEQWYYGRPVRARDLGQYGYVYSPGPDATVCDLSARSQVHYYMVQQAAYDHAVSWVTQGIQPPAAPPIQVNLTPAPTRAVRDSDGIAKGGIRLADVVVPIALNTGWNLGQVSSNNSSCEQAGASVPFLPTAEQQVTLAISATVSENYTLPALSELYPNHMSYVNQVVAVTNQNVAAGFLRKADGQTIMLNAINSQIGN
jgi:hypothetical protein